MANTDIISRLRLDSGEFDSKIKRAGQELLAYSEHCKNMGLQMGYANKDAKDFAKALGSMQTVSQTARGKLNELTEAFVNLKAMYNNMTDAEKQNTFGKELAASLDKLKNRIDEAKQNLNSVNAELGNTKQAEQGATSGIEGLTSALGINLKSLAGWGAALAAGKVALDVAKDAFMSSETNVDDWGRTVRSAEGIYQSFVQSLNTGDFTGFLSNIGRVTQAAQEAYNALDELGTRMTIINPERARLQARQQELRADIRRSGADSDVGRAALAELKKIEPLLSKSFKTESQMNYTAFEKLVRERLAEGGINLNQKSFQQFMKTFSSDAAFQNLRRNARGSSELRETSEIGRFKTVDTRNIEQKLLDLFTDEWRQANSGYLTASFSAQGAAASNALGNARYMRAGSGGGKGGKGGKTNIQFADDSIMAQEKLVSDLTQKWKTASGELRDGYLKDLEEAQKKLAEMKGGTAKESTPQMTVGLSGFNEQTISAWTSIIKSDLAKADIGSDLYNSLTKNLRDMSFLTTTVQDAIKLGLDIPQDAVQQMFEKVFDQGNLPTDMYTGMIQKFIDEFKERTGKDLQVGENGSLSTGKDKKNDDRSTNKLLKLNEETGKYEAKANELLSTMSGGIQNITNGLESLGIEIPAELKSVLGGMQSISAILTGIATTVLAIQAITTADAIIPFAGGGIVGRAASGMLVGSHMSGDNLRMPVMGGSGGFIGVNDGEVILNRAQQGNLASQLDGGGIGNLHLDTIISGEDIRVVLKNNGRRTGRGEYITSRNSRS